MIFVPIGGLANRMRMIDSAIRLSSMTTSNYKIYWNKDKGLNCSFSKIWEPIKNLYDVKNIYLIYLLLGLRLRFPFTKFFLFLDKVHLLKIISEEECCSLMTEQYDFLLLKKYKFSIIVTCENFYPPPPHPKCDSGYDEFTLTDNLRKMVNTFIEIFPENIIGIHIRRTDNKNSIKFSPLSSFFSLMQSMLDKEDNIYFYVASDDEDVKKQMKEKFNDKVILLQGAIGRDTEERILFSVVELYALSRTKKIYGSYWSSYSETAAAIGKINLEVVNETVE